MSEGENEDENKVNIAWVENNILLGGLREICGILFEILFKLVKFDFIFIFGFFRYIS